MTNTDGLQGDAELVKLVRSLALDGYEGPHAGGFASRENYRWLTDLGSHLWLDTGDAAAAEKVWAAETDALTTNNTLVNQVVQTGAMDEMISRAAKKIRKLRPDMSMAEMVIEVGFLANARLALSLVQKLNAHVSVELHPGMAFDIERSLAYARRYFDVCSEFFYVKVPMTPDGFVATRQLSAEGIPVNYTLGFSARQNLLATAFSHPRYVNVFLGRLNAVVEENKLGEPENVGEKAALASYEVVKGLRQSDKGIQTEQIAASLRSGRQVATLAGVDVLTIPPNAAQEYLDLDVRKEEVRRRESKDLQVTLSPDGQAMASKLAELWDVDLAFGAFVRDAVSRADEIADGRSLVELSRKHGLNLFHNWTAKERQMIREKGKIPDLAQWPGMGIDDVMSTSALESFVKDQAALDQRIESLARDA